MALTPEQEDFLKNIKKQFDAAKEVLDVERDLSSILERQNNSLSSYISSQKQISQNARRIQLTEDAIEELLKRKNELLDKGKGLTDDLLKAYEEEMDNLDKLIDKTNKKLKQDKQDLEILQKNLSLRKVIGNQLDDMVDSLIRQNFQFLTLWGYLQAVDKEIRQIQLGLGVSGEKAAMMRRQFEESVNATERLGVGAKELAAIQSSIAAQTGRAFSFTYEQNRQLASILKGTGLQQEEAGRLVGTMTQLGKTIGTSKELIEESINSTAQLGLSSSEVLKELSQNIDKVNQYRFQNGIKGLEQMVKNSKQFRVAMEGAFNFGEKFRTLEGLLETGAQLRVLGGEFAKLDEFKLSFLARNKPEELVKEIANLTKGMATFNKVTGEFDISDVDYDKLGTMANLAGMDIAKLADGARQVAQIKFAKRQLLIGTDAEKEMLAGLAKFKPGSTIGYIQIDDKEVRLDELTRDQIDLYKQTQKTLEERSKDSQTFNDALTYLVNQLKSTLLPALKLINLVLDGFHYIVDGFRDENGKLNELLAAIPLTGMLIAPLGIKYLWQWLGSLRTMMFGKKIVESVTQGAAAQTASQTLAQGRASAAMTAATGKANALNMAALGVAAIGVGAGFMMAAKGASMLADSISKLNGNGQLATLIGVSTVLGATLAGTLYYGIIALGEASAIAAPELYALGGAALMLGGAIALAAALPAAIGYMVNSFGNLFTSVGKLSELDFSKLTDLGTSLKGLGSVNLDNLEPMQNLKIVDEDIKNMKAMADIVNQLTSIDTSNLNAISKMFENAKIKVQIDGNVPVQNNVSVSVDGKPFYRKVQRNFAPMSQQGFDLFGRGANFETYMG